MFMQAWGNYGTAWSVVHQQLGVRPFLNVGRLQVVPQVPGSSPISGDNIRLGAGKVSVKASHTGSTWKTTVDARVPVKLEIGATLPRDAKVGDVLLDGKAVHRYDKRVTNRGLEVTVVAAPGAAHTVTVTGG
jgi:hypothetical protein